MTLLTKTKDDQQYGQIVAVLNGGSDKSKFRVQCHGRLDRVGPWLRLASSVLKGQPQKPNYNDWVLIGYNYQDKKTCKILKVYKNKSDLRFLLENAIDCEVPKSMISKLQQQLHHDDDDDEEEGENDEVENSSQ